jgi:hypothetical protein
MNIITQPAFLTNYQQYYTGLRQGLNTEALAEKLRRDNAEQKEKKRQKERRETGELVLAVTALLPV